MSPTSVRYLSNVTPPPGLGREPATTCWSPHRPRAESSAVQSHAVPHSKYVDVKLGRRRKSHNGWAGWLAYIVS